MKTFTIIIAVIAAVACGLTIAVADDWMIVTTNEGAQQFNLANVESITFSMEPEGLVAYYPFNENANDESGHGNNGDVQGATLTRDRHGNANTAYHFTAANQNYISVVDNDLLDMHQGEGLTVVFWIRTEVEGTEQAFGGKYNWGIGGWVFDQTRSGYAYFSGRAPGAYVYNDSSNVVINDNQWHMVVGIIDGRIWSNWVDGELQRTVDSGNPNPSMNNAEPLCIGCYTDSGQRFLFWEGDIDDVRIYNRALTEAEILALFEE